MLCGANVEVDVAELVVAVDEIDAELDVVSVAKVADAEMGVVMVADIPDSDVEAVLVAKAAVVVLEKMLA